MGKGVFDQQQQQRRRRRRRRRRQRRQTNISNFNNNDEKNEQQRLLISKRQQITNKNNKQHHLERCHKISSSSLKTTSSSSKQHLKQQRWGKLDKMACIQNVIYIDQGLNERLFHGKINLHYPKSEHCLSEPLSAFICLGPTQVCQRGIIFCLGKLPRRERCRQYKYASSRQLHQRSGCRIKQVCNLPYLLLVGIRIHDALWIQNRSDTIPPIIPHKLEGGHLKQNDLRPFSLLFPFVWIHLYFVSQRKNLPWMFISDFEIGNVTNSSLRACTTPPQFFSGTK